jgi:hypothetical protein
VGVLEKGKKGLSSNDSLDIFFRNCGSEIVLVKTIWQTTRALLSNTEMAMTLTTILTTLLNTWDSP